MIMMMMYFIRQIVLHKLLKILINNKECTVYGFGYAIHSCVCSNAVLRDLDGIIFTYLNSILHKTLF